MASPIEEQMDFLNTSELSEEQARSIAAGMETLIRSARFGARSGCPLGAML